MTKKEKQLLIIISKVVMDGIKKGLTNATVTIDGVNLGDLIMDVEEEA
jgi:hypothetical protein